MSLSYELDKKTFFSLSNNKIKWRKSEHSLLLKKLGTILNLTWLKCFLVFYVEGLTVTFRWRTATKAPFLCFYVCLIAVHVMILCPWWIPPFFFYISFILTRMNGVCILCYVEAIESFLVYDMYALLYFKVVMYLLLKVLLSCHIIF